MFVPERRASKRPAAFGLLSKKTRLATKGFGNALQ